MGCEKGLSNIELLACANRMDPNLLLNKSSTYFFVKDNDVFHKSIYELSAEKAFKKCNIITGFNTDEFSFFAPFLGIFPLDKPSSWEEMAKKIDFNLFSKFFLAFGGNQLDENYLDNVLSQYMPSTEMSNLNSSSINYFNYLNRILTGN